MGFLWEDRGWEEKMIEELRSYFQRYIEAEEISDGEWYEEMELCCKKEMELLAANIEESIRYLKNECTAKEFVLISEFIEELAEETKSMKLINTYEELKYKYPAEYKKYNIKSFLEDAKSILEDEI